MALQAIGDHWMAFGEQKKSQPLLPAGAYGVVRICHT